MKSEQIDVDELRRLVNYDPMTGAFTWKVSTWRVRAGDKCGCSNDQGYLVITILRHQYTAHRLAWVYIYGSFPQDEIDHIDGNRLNNRLTNLRDVSHSTNMQNRRSARSDNACGLLGAHFYKRNKINPWCSQIGIRESGRRRRKHLGYFPTAELASAAYLTAKRLLHEGCTI